ncbi:enoyl-CoA hydratase/isomerase family protein [Pseudonocardia sp. CA-107938]|uniref:enoyl-CoA hydratase/isomerase family protein n=1 Tax=Pseudonocardia sp. CA-107938 TaxID=3240021 RepID=UPI003D8A753F
MTDAAPPPSAGEPAPAVLLREHHGAVLLATLNRPTKGNALSRPLIDALDRFAADVAADHATGGDRRIRAVVLTGAGGRAFSAGADITELDGIGGLDARTQMRHGQAVFDRIEALPVPVVAAIDGVALGGGLELAMAADIRLASPGSRLGQPEITLANLPGWGGTQRLPRLVGSGLATEMILLGDPVDAERAAAIGLVNRVVADPVTAALELAARLAGNSATAIRGAKEAIHAGLTHGIETGLVVEADAVAACCGTAEQRAAVQAFLNRRRPAPAAASTDEEETPR